MPVSVWLLIGAFIGWNLPQPPWAVAIQAKLKAKFAAWFTSKL